MKLKILSITSFIILSVCFFHLLIYPTVVLKVTTNAPESKITLEYKNDQGILKKIPVIVMGNGKAEFSVPTKRLTSFQLLVPNSEKIEKLIVKSKKNQKLDIPASYDFKNLNIEGTLLFGFRLFLWAEFLSAITCFMIPYCVINRKFKIPLSDNKKILNIEFLRVFFTIGVVCCHFFGILGLKNFGGRGVEFFFILSGYFLYLTFKPTLSTPDFIKKKVIAWLPLIMFGSILCGGYLSCLKDIFFLQNTGLAYEDITNSPAWFLGVLMWVLVFYFYMIKTLSQQQCNLVIGFISFISYVICAQSLGNRYEMIYSYFPRGMFRGLASVGAGYILAQFCIREEKNPESKNFLFWTILELFSVVWIVLRIFICEVPTEWIFSPISFLLIIYLFIKKRGWISQKLEHPFWSLVSRYSLAVYLIHWSVTGMFVKYSSIYGEYFFNNRVIAIGLVLTSCSILGIFAYHAVQKPAEKWLKEHWR